MFNNYTYLYVEDDAPSRQVMKFIMQSMNIEHFSMFENSQDFLTKLKKLEPRPNVILLDIQMKPHDGFAVLRMIRSEPNFADSIVIALTASVMNEQVERLKDSGFNGAIAKPLQFRVFPDLMSRILRGDAVWHIA